MAIRPEKAPVKEKVKESKEKAEPTKGLRGLINHPKEESVLCDNCRCYRYGSCGCMRKKS